MHNFCYEGPIVRANETPCNTCHPLWTNVRHFSTELWCIISPLYYNVITAPCPRANGNHAAPQETLCHPRVALCRPRAASTSGLRQPLWRHNVSFGAHNFLCPSDRGAVIFHCPKFGTTWDQGRSKPKGSTAEQRGHCCRSCSFVTWIERVV